LPAALFCVLVCAVATIVFVPVSLWGQFLAEMRASTLYVQNWQLASDAVDYFAAAQNSPSPSQHFWSLAVEEPFSPACPLVGRAPPPPRRTLLAAVVAVTVASLGYSLFQTAANPGAAYFAT